MALFEIVKTMLLRVSSGSLGYCLLVNSIIRLNEAITQSGTHPSESISFRRYKSLLRLSIEK